jgi:cystathionine beta-lyase
MVDNSIMTPVYQRPLELGADISMISATKFVGGHSDVTGGILSFKSEELGKRCVFKRETKLSRLGVVLSVSMSALGVPAKGSFDSR